MFTCASICIAYDYHVINSKVPPPPKKNKKPNRIPLLTKISRCINQLWPNMQNKSIEQLSFSCVIYIMFDLLKIKINQIRFTGNNDKKVFYPSVNSIFSLHKKFKCRVKDNPL